MTAPAVEPTGTRDAVPDQYTIAIDVGGTCTDCAVVDTAGRVLLEKTFSTPPDFAEGMLRVLDQAAARLGTDGPGLLSRTRLFLHSTTVAENAVVDGSLARAGLLMTSGFEETVISMRGGYGRWSGLSELAKRDPMSTEKPPPLIPRQLTRGVRERVDSTGLQLVAPDLEEVKRAVAELLAAGVESLAISCLWSFLNPESENAVRTAVLSMKPDAFVTCSHELAPTVGEYERASTAALNARLGPVVARYLSALVGGLRERGFTGDVLIMQASGGLLPIEEAATRPVGMIESGPVGGVVGSNHVGARIGLRNIICADMGGTTFKVGIVRDGMIEYQRESMVFRYHYSLPKMDVTSLGIAGGSIISVDERTGIPHVGPRSAGSYPGPVCYGHGGDEPTVTDVDAVLGYLNPAFFLDGTVPLNVDAAREAFEERVAKPLGLPVEEAAAGVYRLANSMMYDLLHKTTVQRGLDPRNYALVSFGGTAGMHVSAYAGRLGVRKTVVPYSASVQGAFGLLTADIGHEAQVTRPLRMPVPAAELAGIYSGLERALAGQLREEGFGPDAISLARSVDMRYARQVHILTVPFPEGEITGRSLDEMLERFQRLYEEKYGKDSGYLGAGVELVAFRVRGMGTVTKPEFRRAELTRRENPAEALVVTRRAWIEDADEFRDVPGYAFELMGAGDSITGPASVWTPSTTVVLGARDRAEVDGYRNLIVEPAGRADVG